MSERERDLKLYIHWRPAPTRKNGKKKEVEDGKMNIT